MLVNTRFCFLLPVIDIFNGENCFNYHTRNSFAFQITQHNCQSKAFTWGCNRGGLKRKQSQNPPRNA